MRKHTDNAEGLMIGTSPTLSSRPEQAIRKANRLRSGGTCFSAAIMGDLFTLALFLILASNVVACTRIDLDPLRVADHFDVVLRDRDRPVMGIGVVVERWRERSNNWEKIAVVTTDATGLARFSGMAVGSYVVRTNNPIANDSTRIEVTADFNKPVAARVELSWPPKKVILTKVFEGTLATFPEPEEPSWSLSGIQLIVSEAYSGRKVAAEFTDQDGHFKVEGLPPGLYFIELKGPDNLQQRRQFFGEPLHGTLVVEYNTFDPAAVSSMPLQVAINSCSTLMYKVAN